jgi:hypothetical protein
LAQRQSRALASSILLIRKIRAIEWPFGGLGTEGRVGAPRFRGTPWVLRNRGPSSPQPTLSRCQSKFSESGRLEAQELEQVNDRPGRSPGRIRHSLAHDLVTHLQLDPHIFDARPLARLHDKHPIGRSPYTAKNIIGSAVSSQMSKVQKAHFEFSSCLFCLFCLFYYLIHGAQRQPPVHLCVHTYNTYIHTTCISLQQQVLHSPT